MKKNNVVDFLGEVPLVGDEVVTIEPYYKTLKKGVVVKLTEKGVDVEYTRDDRFFTVFRSPSQFLVLTPSRSEAVKNCELFEACNRVKEELISSSALSKELSKSLKVISRLGAVVLEKIEAKNAKWTIYDNENFSCNNCGELYPTNCNSILISKMLLENDEVPNYCPSCGKYMKEN